MAKYQGRTVTLNKPFRTPGKSKKSAVYVRNRRTGRVQIVRFGQPGMSIKKNNPARRRSFIARFTPILNAVRGQKTLSPAYWSLKAWR
tara:strand:+ start:348 stop:611 length:264 start_codon:yes stop_codon:yes gene_type:complete